jgi:hypothetical protein
MSLGNLARSNGTDAATAANEIMRAKLEHAARQPMVQQILAHNAAIDADVRSLAAERDRKIAEHQAQINAIRAAYDPRIAALEAQRLRH